MRVLHNGVVAAAAAAPGLSRVRSPTPWADHPVGFAAAAVPGATRSRRLRRCSRPSMVVLPAASPPAPMPRAVVEGPTQPPSMESAPKRPVPSSRGWMRSSSRLRTSRRRPALRPAPPRPRRRRRRRPWPLGRLAQWCRRQRLPRACSSWRPSAGTHPPWRRGRQRRLWAWAYAWSSWSSALRREHSYPHARLARWKPPHLSWRMQRRLRVADPRRRRTASWRPRASGRHLRKRQSKRAVTSCRGNSRLS
mmetsp:Transcript_100986/g.281299  ORF Transcript_100986/g.281299 Transcript_100986/m.281299 type:complete len:250 (-) Transcript_100986:570-1319(-)